MHVYLIVTIKIATNMNILFWLVVIVFIVFGNADFVRAQIIQTETSTPRQEEFEKTCNFNNRISFGISLAYGSVAIIVLIGVCISSYNEMRFKTSQNGGISNIRACNCS